MTDAAGSTEDGDLRVLRAQLLAWLLLFRPVVVDPERRGIFRLSKYKVAIETIDTNDSLKHPPRLPMSKSELMDD